MPKRKVEMRAYKDQCLKDLLALEKLVLNEHVRQINKWGVQEHTLFGWHAILSEEVGELATAILNRVYGGVMEKDIKQEAISVATLALKIAEIAKGG